jgi:hypothetical protein
MPIEITGNQCVKTNDQLPIHQYGQRLVGARSARDPRLDLLDREPGPGTLEALEHLTLTFAKSFRGNGRRDARWTETRLRPVFPVLLSVRLRFHCVSFPVAILVSQ